MNLFLDQVYTCSWFLKLQKCWFSSGLYAHGWPKHCLLSKRIERALAIYNAAYRAESRFRYFTWSLKSANSVESSPYRRTKSMLADERVSTACGKYLSGLYISKYCDSYLQVPAEGNAESLIKRHPPLRFRKLEENQVTYQMLFLLYGFCKIS